MLDTFDLLRLLHPMLAATVVMPMIGIVSYFALQTRQRRLAALAQEKTKIPPVVGQEHVKVGRWLAVAVVALVLLGILHPIVKTILAKNTWTTNPSLVLFIVVMYGLTIGSLVLLYRAKAPRWRIIFAVLTGLGLVILGNQDGVYHRDYEWYLSHYYFGMTAALLMIVSVAILPEIYKSPRWRTTHIVLNSIALLLFISQGITGTRDLLEIPLHWQESFIYQCDFAQKVC
ncbi:MAG: DUF4079 domain-containing protein [Synechococcales cyanobacterium]